MLKKLEKFLFETPLKQVIPQMVVFWIAYFFIIGGVNKIVGKVTESNSWMQMTLYGVIVGLFVGGILEVAIDFSIIWARMQIEKEEKELEKQLLQMKDEVAKVFKKTDEVELTIADLKDSVESAILNELEGNDEICLFAKLCGDEIWIGAKMKNGQVYEGIIVYKPDKYDLFLKEFEVL